MDLSSSTPCVNGQQQVYAILGEDKVLPVTLQEVQASAYLNNIHVKLEVCHLSTDIPFQ